MASGYTYISVVMRDTREQGKVPFYSDPEKCDHGFSMCPTWECIESWSMDYQVLLPNTVAGRRLARELGIDPVRFAQADHVGIEMWRIDDFKPMSDAKWWIGNAETDPFSDV